MQFCKEYNEKTKELSGSIVPVEIEVFSDRSFTFTLKSPPASDLIKKAINKKSASGKGKKMSDEREEKKDDNGIKRSESGFKSCRRSEFIQSVN